MAALGADIIGSEWLFASEASRHEGKLGKTSDFPFNVICWRQM